MLNNQNREYGLDLLKIIAFVGVVSLHVLSNVWYELPVDTVQWQIINGFRSTWCVPVFVMVSGRFILDPEKPMPPKKLKTYILRVVSAFLLFTVFYKCVDFFRQGANQSWLTNWKWQLVDLFDGEYHLWYLPMLAGLYLIVPFLRRITEDKKLTQWYLILFFTFQFLNCYGVHLPKIGVLLQPVLDNIGFHFALGYSGYFVMGYYLSQRSYSIAQEYMIYIAGLLCLLAGTAGNSAYALVSGVKTTMFTEPLTPNLIIASAAIFVFFKKRGGSVPFREKTVLWISRLEPLTFGGYLIHALFVNIAIDFFPITGKTVSPVLAVLLQTILIAAASLGCAYVWQKLRCHKKAKRN